MKPKQALSLGAREDVGHEAPEHRDDEHVEYAHPNIEAGGDITVRHLATGEQQIEADNGESDEAIHPGKECRQLDARGHAGVQRRKDQGTDEGARKQLVQMFDAVHGAHGIAYRLDHRVAAEEEKQVHHAQHHGRQLVGLDSRQRLECTRQQGRTIGLRHIGS
ncbi:MAG: hypothetical protein WDM77_00830 [Steroidobacteraceae bacterium]